MLVKTFTLRFDPRVDGFDDEVLCTFTRGKEVLSVRDHFFLKDDVPYWSFLVAILNVLEPAFEARSITHSYACRPGKGMHAAVARARALVRRHPYFWKGDVRRYFDSVSHSTLARMLASLVPDERLLELLLLILAHQPPGAVPGKGIPIGNLTSQHFANLYLGVLDRAMALRPDGTEDGRYLRYMDDVLLFGASKEELHRAQAKAARAQRPRPLPPWLGDAPLEPHVGPAVGGALSGVRRKRDRSRDPRVYLPPPDPGPRGGFVPRVRA